MDAVHAKASAEARLRTLQRAGDTRGAARCREEIAAAQATITASNLRAEEIRREISEHGCVCACRRQRADLQGHRGRDNQRGA